MAQILPDIDLVSLKFKINRHNIDDDCPCLTMFKYFVIISISYDRIFVLLSRTKSVLF